MPDIATVIAGDETVDEFRAHLRAWMEANDPEQSEGAWANLCSLLGIDPE